MRVLQLIDSLQAGGAERMAVNIANMLSVSKDINMSYLCVTREEGILKESLLKEVSYLFLNKKRTIDIKAIRKLNRLIKRENINIIHAHSSSFFLATIIKISNRKLKLIWHDHYGKSEFLDERKSNILKFCSRHFNHVYSVNSKLEAWSKNYLKAKNTSYLSNFVIRGDILPETQLFGTYGKRIVHLANLRPQKDHITLIKAFAKVLKKQPEWTLHCIGKDFNDDYSREIKGIIKEFKLRDYIYIYGSKIDINHILSQSDIGVLSSISEGLPLALLEYGLEKLAVIATDVGDCNKIISHSSEGVLINPQDSKTLEEVLLNLIQDSVKRYELGNNLHNKIVKKFNTKTITNQLIANYKA